MSSPAEQSHVPSPKTQWKSKGVGLTWTDDGGQLTTHGVEIHKNQHRALATYSDKLLTSTKTAPKYQNHKDVNERADQTVQSSWMTSAALHMKGS